MVASSPKTEGYLDALPAWARELSEILPRAHVKTGKLVFQAAWLFAGGRVPGRQRSDLCRARLTLEQSHSKEVHTRSPAHARAGGWWCASAPWRGF